MGMADSVSPYAYVANNPVNLIDPNGLLAQLTGTARPEAYWGMMAANDTGTTSDVVKSWMSLVPGADAMNNATANFKAGNYGSAALWGIGALADAALAIGTGGESTAAKTTVEAVTPSILKNVASDGIGYNSSRALRNAMSPASGEQIHHIVEQTPSNIANFGAQVIHNTANAVPVAADIHIGQGSISAYYSSKVPRISGDQTIRQWLSGQSYDAQYQFGLDTLRSFGVLP
jgi:hypothetical protein